MSSIYTPYQNARECTRRRQQGLHLSPMAPPRTAPVRLAIPTPEPYRSCESHYVLAPGYHVSKTGIPQVVRCFPKIRGTAAVRAHKRARQAQQFGTMHRRYQRQLAAVLSDSRTFRLLEQARA